MENFLYSYQHLPEHLNPAAFSFGPISIDWYSLMYLVGFLVVYFLLRHRIKKDQINNSFPESPVGDSGKRSVSESSLRDSDTEEISNFQYPIKSQISNLRFRKEQLLDLLLYIFIGLLIGARLGYVLFYNLSYYIQNPLAIVSPFDPLTHQFVGIYGMSYHGGLLGAILAAWIFSKKYKIYPVEYCEAVASKTLFHRVNFWNLANFVAPAIPAGYFFGRIGNFLNGELYGRITDKFWGMYFPTGGVYLRHPSQLYEAFLEGLVLFLILWPLRNKGKFKSHLFIIYILGYAGARFILEFFREPDPQIGFILGFFTLGQILSLLMMMAAGAFFLFQKHHKGGII
jgi:phosphatidylglycerol:prolipoprotein diacylglycerol transferase